MTPQSLATFGVASSSPSSTAFRLFPGIMILEDTQVLLEKLTATRDMLTVVPSPLAFQSSVGQSKATVMARGIISIILLQTLARVSSSLLQKTTTLRPSEHYALIRVPSH